MLVDSTQSRPDMMPHNDYLIKASASDLNDVTIFVTKCLRADLTTTLPLKTSGSILPVKFPTWVLDEWIVIC